MTFQTSTLPEPDLDYPESDGKPMADNTKQFRWIVTIQGNLDDLFRDDPNVFVAGDLFWYPVQGRPAIVTAPDALVAIGRPKGDRRSYMQWREGGIAPQVVFEVRSPNNTDEELEGKLAFYDRYGVEEYYLYDPDNVELSGWRRVGENLQPIPQMRGWISPRLGIRFELSGRDLVIYHPDGRRFLTFIELALQKEQAQRQAEQAQRQAEQAQRQAEQAQRQAEQAQRQAEQAQRQAEQSQRQAEQERLAKEQATRQAEQERLAKEQVQREAEKSKHSAEQERQAAEKIRQHAQRLAEQLRALGIDPSE